MFDIVGFHFLKLQREVYRVRLSLGLDFGSGQGIEGSQEVPIQFLLFIFSCHLSLHLWACHFYFVVPLLCHKFPSGFDVIAT